MPKGIYIRTEEHTRQNILNLGTGWLGKKRPPFSKEWRSNMRKAHLNKKLSIFTKNKLSEIAKKNGFGKYMIGRKQKLSTIKKRIPKISKENHYNWKGGISKNSHSLTDPRYKRWRNRVFERDKWTCQKCNQVGGKLEPHHIKSWAAYPGLRYYLRNGLTLCSLCHADTDNYRGRSKTRLNT